MRRGKVLSRTYEGSFFEQKKGGGPFEEKKGVILTREEYLTCY